MSLKGNPRSRTDRRATGPADATDAGCFAEAGDDLQTFVDSLSPARVGWWGGVAFFGALSFLTLAYAAYFLNFSGQGCCDQAAWGQFGDFIGGVANPVLGLFTLLGLAFTVWLQMRQIEMARAQLRLAHEQLALSRSELELTRRELERSANAQHEAAEAMKGQLEQAHVTAKAQTDAAKHQLATAEAMREQTLYSQAAMRMQILSGGLDAFTPRAESIGAWTATLTQAVSGSLHSGGDYREVAALRQDCLKQLVELVRGKGLVTDKSSPPPHSPSKTPA